MKVRVKLGTVAIPSICVICASPSMFDSPADSFAVCTECNYVVVFREPNMRAFPLEQWRAVAESQGHRYGGVA